jgi:hypothetical protein
MFFLDFECVVFVLVVFILVVIFVLCLIFNGSRFPLSRRFPLFASVIFSCAT